MSDRMCDRVDCAAEPRERWWEETAYRVVSFFESDAGYYLILFLLRALFFLAIGLMMRAATS